LNFSENQNKQIDQLIEENTQVKSVRFYFVKIQVTISTPFNLVSIKYLLKNNINKKERKDNKVKI
jgi:hypothetical protein